MAEKDIPVSSEAHSQNVNELQGYLRGISVGGVPIPLIIPDGIYGEQTAQAVKAFQNHYGLEPTGEADLRTWQSIYEVFSDIRDNLSDEDGIMPFPSNSTVLETGDGGTVVIILQAMLNTLAGHYINLNPVEVTGFYDSSTAAAVADIQNIFGMQPTGKSDLRTWNNIVRLFNSFS
ncbi:MAG: peptidoglycan-binding protein [Huintestinicola sp.]